MSFKLQHTDQNGKARAGVFKTSHGVFETPVFMPVGTIGSVKTVFQEDLAEKVKTGIILGNTYHLFLRPGMEIIKAAGGLHQFIGWSGSLLTDSGGYQIYSLSQRRKISEEGVSFQSHIDGSYHFFTPEKVIDIQRNIGADIIMAFDECPPYPAEKKYVEESLDLTERWWRRCKDQMFNTECPYGYRQYLAPIVQGGAYPELRKRSSLFVAEQPGPVKAIGGLSVGEPKEIMYGMTELNCDILPQSDARYLMGVGTPKDLLNCISRGVDMFDCVLPTRNARHGILYTPDGIINIRNAKWKQNFETITYQNAPGHDMNYNLGYLRHLFLSGESLGPQIATLINLSFYTWLMSETRKNILNNTFSSWYTEMIPKISRRL